MSDLLNTLGKKTNTNSAEGAGNKSEPQTATSSVAASNRGDNILAKANGTGTQDIAENSVKPSAEASQTPNQTSSKIESTGDGQDDWTTDSALKEVKKLREENKAYRLKYQQELEKLKVESDARLEAQKQEVEAFKQAKQELDKIKAEQEDKKRDLTEKLAHRESRLSQIEAVLDAKEKEWSRKLSEQETIVRQYKAEREAEAQVYQNKVDEELSKIPVKYQDYAKLLVKGAGDSREALVALSEAKIKGMFDDKTIVVNHSTPGASDGARSGKERMEEVERSRRDKMSSSQKIGEALKNIKSGNPNSVFRTK